MPLHSRENASTFPISLRLSTTRRSACSSRLSPAALGWPMWSCPFDLLQWQEKWDGSLSAGSSTFQGERRPRQILVFGEQLLAARQGLVDWLSLRCYMELGTGRRMETLDKYSAWESCFSIGSRGPPNRLLTGRAADRRCCYRSGAHGISWLRSRARSRMITGACARL